MGLYKLCDHKGRTRDRCDHPWWGSYRGTRVSLSKWTNRDVPNRAAAETALDDLRAMIRAGTFDPRGAQPPDTRGRDTFADLAKLYVERHVEAHGLSSADAMPWRLKDVLAAFGPTPIAEITTAAIQDFIADLKKPRTVNRQPNRTLKPASVNRQIALLRHMFAFAEERELIARSPFRRGGRAVIRLEREDNRRSRRIGEAEETALLAAAPPHLRALMTFALDTGARLGETLALAWGDVDLTRKLVTFRGDTTKSGRTRVVPLATLRLIDWLKFLQPDAIGEPKPATAPVFSNVVGEPLAFPRKAWEATILRAHGITPAYTKRTKGLTGDCRAALRRIDLRWHDLRHEYASRLTERNVPISQVRDLLGHASIVTTQRYDNQTLQALVAAAATLERGATCDPTSEPTTPPDPASTAVADGATVTH